MRDRDSACTAFGAKVRDLRGRQGLSQEEFADLVGIHRTYIGGIERGERNPTLTTIKKIAAALGVPDWLLLCHDERIIEAHLLHWGQRKLETAP